MVWPDGTSFRVPHNPVLATDMRRLGARLQDDAVSHGTRVIGHVREVRAELATGGSEQ